MERMILALDQGTTSTRAIVFDLNWRPRALSQVPLEQHFPKPGWVEHDAEEIWRASLSVGRAAIAQAGGPERIAAIGLTNQRETAVVWERATGRPIHRAIVWQDRRTADLCARLAQSGRAAEVKQLSGLELDPYFSASKIAWILDHVEGARGRAQRGELCAGTIDSWLMFKLSGGAHVTDVTNASRTSLFDLQKLDWSDALIDLFGVPARLLPEVRPCAGLFAEAVAEHFGAAVPITGVAGDQQASLVGHGALQAGAAKITYGTGAFLMANVGDHPAWSERRLLGTVGYQAQGRTAWALEGSIFSAGSAVQWLRDGLQLFETSADSEALALSLKDNDGVYLVPAFTGLGAPWWAPHARGGVLGLTRDSRPAHFARAALEALGYQTHDLLQALAADGAPPAAVLKADGGVTANGFAMQFLADITGVPVERPAFQELTALGAARLAAIGAGLIDTLEIAPTDPPTRWEPQMTSATRKTLLDGWARAVASVLSLARRPEAGA